MTGLGDVSSPRPSPDLNTSAQVRLRFTSSNFPLRETFVIDPQGKIAHHIEKVTGNEAHSKDVLAFLDGA